MIVRISGSGQYDLDDTAAHRLHDFDLHLTEALHAGQEAEFHRLLHETITYIREHGQPVPASEVVPSEVIVPPEDVTLAEARSFFDEDSGLMDPLPA
ncbi:MAG TPA: hypothetical protein VFB58_08290 [Chloroflexota bacterium]|nr:hypothetical protein [Chloroflexota bacterium]